MESERLNPSPLEIGGVMKINRSASVTLLLAVSLSSIGASLSENAWASRPLLPAKSYNKTAGVNLVAANLQLDCQGSGELSGTHPGWSREKAINLTRVDISTYRHMFYWCAASAPSGGGKISYTLTSFLGGITCETTQTFCEMDGVPAGLNFQIMATDQTGSYLSPMIAIQNSGTTLPCKAAINYCNSGPGNLTFPSYGNGDSVGIGNCTFAAVANWEKIVLGTVPDTSLIQSEFIEAGGTPNLGLTNSQVFSYWRTHGIGGTYLDSELPFYSDPVQLMNAIDNPRIRAVIASINLAKGQSFAGYTMSDASYHWIVVVGYTPQGPLVASWGRTLQMTWQQWNLEIVAMWGITTRS